MQSSYGSLQRSYPRFLVPLQVAPGPAIFTLVVTVGGTLITHYQLRRNIAGPLKNLALEIAANIDIQEGELDLSDADAQPSTEAVEELLYAQPSLKASADERGPLPYRREKETASSQSETHASARVGNDDIELSSEAQTYEV